MTNKPIFYAQNIVQGIFWGITLSLGAITLPASAASSFTFGIDPRSTYLRTNEDTFAQDAISIDLLDLGISGGDTIKIEGLGDFEIFIPNIVEDRQAMIGLFSSSHVLLPSNELNRVVGAINAGIDFPSSPTFDGQLTTDIPEDFLISSFDNSFSSITIEVPDAANYLFVGGPDSFFGDNVDPNGDYAVRITAPGNTATEFTIDPKATYLKTNNDPLALNTIPINLGDLGITSGDSITIEALGDFSIFAPPITRRIAMVGVFSNNDLLLPANELNRVSGAIDFGMDFLSSPTFDGGLTTDIAEDFFIRTFDDSFSSITIQVPLEATHLFVGAPDSFFGDNLDPDDDYAVRITNLSESVPEPSTVLGLIGLGLSGLIFRRRDRQD